VFNALAVLVKGISLLASAAAGVTSLVGNSVPYDRPVPGAVVRGFEQPATAYSAGHRGVDLGTAPAESIHADADGTVSFSGTLAGRGIVVLVHADGVRTEFEPVHPLVKRGASVARGDVIATIDGTHAGCAPDRCLHWGARRGRVYFDPLLLLRPLGVVRLLPAQPP
jgi:murein DD-endopeptidase MepM/ murein hydrolase activator NlpD